MRYADGPSTHVDIDIAAAPDRVWELVTDITLPARFSEEFQGAEWIPPHEAPEVGASFIGHNEHSAVGTWDSTSHVTECEPNRVFGWAVSRVEDPAASWRFTLGPSEAGTFLRYTCTLGPGPSGLTPAIEAMPDKEERIVERRLAEHKANMQRTVEGIRDLAEG